MQVRTPDGRHFVGRDPELAQLAATLAPPWDGPRLVRVLGEPGIGKTRLLGQYAELARQRGTALCWGRAAEFERHQPFAIIADAIGDWFAAYGPDRLATLIGEDNVRLLRVIGSGRWELPDAARVDEVMGAERYRLHRAVGALLELVAEPAGLLLVLDDTHWADEASCELLDYLLRNPPRGQLVLAMAYRPRQVCTRMSQAMSVIGARWTTELVELAR